MKKLMMIAVMMVAVMSSNAQEAGTMFIKPMAGGQFTTVTGSDSDNTKMKAGVVGGAEFGYKVKNNLGLTAGLLYSNQGCRVKDDEGDFNSNANYLNVPVLVNYYVIPNLALKIGGQVGFLMSAKSDDDDIKDMCNKVDFSIPFGVAFEAKDGWVVEARYNLGLTNVMKKDIVGKNNHNSVIMVTFGYKIPLNKK